MATNLDRDYVATANAAGVATISIGPTGIQQWLVRQVNIELPDPSPSGATCRWRKNGGAGSPLVPDTDTAGGDPPVMLRPSDKMTIEWTGLNSGQTCRAMAFYDEVEWGT